MRKYKGAVFFDFDGTLVDEREDLFEPTDATKNSIERLKQNGYMTCLATGRARCYVPKISFDFDCYVTSNGACAVVDDEFVIDDKISTADMLELKKYFDENGYGFVTENDEKCYFGLRHNEGFIRMMENFNLDMSCFFEFPDDPEIVSANKLMFTYEGEESYKKLLEKFGDRYNITRHRSNPSGDLVKKYITKAFGINAVIKSYGLDIRDTYAFGDGENDYDMLTAVGNPVIMERHAARLDKIGGYVTESVVHEGVTRGLEHFGLI